MMFLHVVRVFLQLIIYIKPITSQASSTTFRPIKNDATIVGIEPFQTQRTFSITECYLACLQQTDERCFYVEVANVNEAWSCKLFRFFTEDIKKYLKPLKGSNIGASPYMKTRPLDCVDAKQHGVDKNAVYSITTMKGGSPTNVYCDMTTDGGGWIVIQRRIDGSVNFNRGWSDYKNGFGDVNGEYWLGNEFVHQYTKMYQTEMKIEAVAFDGVNASTKLQNFTLSDEASKYIFEYDSCSGLCYNFANMKGMNFTTSDQDNDQYENTNCALKYFGGWWFIKCFEIYFNGKYSNVETVVEISTGIHWLDFRYYDKSLKEAKMMIRRIQ